MLWSWIICMRDPYGAWNKLVNSWGLHRMYWLTHTLEVRPRDLHVNELSWWFSYSKVKIIPEQTDQPRMRAKHFNGEKRIERRAIPSRWGQLQLGAKKVFGKPITRQPGQPGSRMKLRRWCRAIIIILKKNSGKSEERKGVMKWRTGLESGAQSTDQWSFGMYLVSSSQCFLKLIPLKWTENKCHFGLMIVMGSISKMLHV